jgi:endonuclease YncB( thermonuclease family)
MRNIDPTKLARVPLPEMPRSRVAPDEAYVDRENGVVVQVWANATPGCDGTPWAGTLRVAVKHTSATTAEGVFDRSTTKPIEWGDLQAIKDHFWSDQIAVEIFPPKDKIVDVADMRWLWVLPPGAVLPFNLQASQRRLESNGPAIASVDAPVLRSDRLHIYKAVVVAVLDGDTFRLRIDQGFRDSTEEDLRLYGIDAPEMRTEEGKELKRIMELLYPAGSSVIVQSILASKNDDQRSDKFGRYLAILYDEWPTSPRAINNRDKILAMAPTSRNAKLIHEGLAQERYW